MGNRTILITGAAGEIGHSISEALSSRTDCQVILLDLKEASGQKTSPNATWVTGDISDRARLEAIFARHDFTHIVHLAAILSTGGEKDPLRAHRINVEGSLNLLDLAQKQSERRRAQGGAGTVFVFPSSIAAYGIPSAALKYGNPSVKEAQFLDPITMYGANKLYVEHLGRYFSTHFGSLTTPVGGERRGLIDFRSVRFPGLLSADTVPTGGTSDYGPEMIHAAAQGKTYHCFVTAPTVLPFMAMPDAVQCLLQLMEAPAAKLSQRVYNVGSFSISAEEIRRFTLAAFPGAEIDFVVDPRRHQIVESWPMGMDDSAARRDWGWKPRFSKEATFSEYLIPRITERYSGAGSLRAAAAHA